MKLGLVFAAAVAIAGCYDPDDDANDGPATSNAGTTPGSSGGAADGGAPASSGGPAGSSGGVADAGPGTATPAKCSPATKSYGTLKMTVCVPSGMEGKTAAPAGLVVALHGYTQGVEQGAWGYKPTTQWEVLAEKHKFYVIYPDKGTAAFSWYAFFGTSGIARTDLEPTNIAAMVADMKAAHNIDADKVFVNGLSAGGYMAVVMLATYPDVFAAGSTFAGGAYGCSTSCAALGKKGTGWTWPGNHASTLVTGAHASWKSPTARKPRLMVFQGDADGAVTPENLADLTQQWKGALGVTSAAATSTLKGHALSEYSKDGKVVLSTLLLAGIGHGTPVDPGTGADQGGWDPEPSKTMSSDANAKQDWTNSAGIYGPYYSAKFFGLVP